MHQLKYKKIAYLLLLFVIFGCDQSVDAEKEKNTVSDELSAKDVLADNSSGKNNDNRADTYYSMALLDEKNNDLKSMRENLLKSIELNPSLMIAHEKLGKIHLLFGDYDKALQQVDILLKNDSKSEEALLLKASVSLKQGKKNEAIEIVDSVKASNPASINAISIKAAIFYDDNNYTKALEEVNYAIEKDSANLALMLFRIRINTKIKNIDAVIEDYKRIISLKPDINDFKLSLASIYSMSGKIVEAEQVLRELVSKQQDRIETKIVLLEFLNAKAKDRVPAELELMLVENAEKANILIELSKWMLVSGYVDLGESALNKVIALEVDSNIGLKAKTILAEIALNRKDYPKAEKALEEVLNSNSEFIEASLLKSRMYLTQNRTDEAIEILNKNIWDKNYSDVAFELLGQAYLIKKDVKQADKNFKQALEVNPANVNAFLNVYNSYLRANQKETARHVLDRAIKSKPNQVVFLTNKVELDISESKWDQAIETLQSLLIYSRNKTIPAYLEANILQGTGEYRQAIDEYQKILVDFPQHVNSMKNLAKSYQALNLTKEAIDYFEDYRKRFPANIEVVNVLTELYASNKEYDKAKKILADQIKQNPKVIGLYLALARLEVAVSQNIDAAKKVYQQGLENNPKDIELMLTLAGLYEHINDYESAKGLYEKIIADKPTEAIAINNLASLLVESDDSNNVSKALLLAEKLKNSDNVYFLDTYAWTLVKAGKTEDGLSILESIIVKEPKIAEFRYHLGVAHLNGGNKATAANELKQAIALSDKQKRGFRGKEIAVQLLKKLNTPS